MAAKSQPLSIESLLQKQKEEKEAAAKVSICSVYAIHMLTTVSAQVPHERAKGAARYC
jgi:hypothetical protein